MRQLINELENHKNELIGNIQLLNNKYQLGKSQFIEAKKSLSSQLRNIETAFIAAQEQLKWVEGKLASLASQAPAVVENVAENVVDSVSKAVSDCVSNVVESASDSVNDIVEALSADDVVKKSSDSAE